MGMMHRQVNLPGVRCPSESISRNQHDTLASQFPRGTMAKWVNLPEYQYDTLASQSPGSMRSREVSFWIFGFSQGVF